MNDEAAALDKPGQRRFIGQTALDPAQTAASNLTRREPAGKCPQSSFEETRRLQQAGQQMPADESSRARDGDGIVESDLRIRTHGRGPSIDAQQHG